MEAEIIPLDWMGNATQDKYDKQRECIMSPLSFPLSFSGITCRLIIRFYKTSHFTFLKRAYDSAAGFAGAYGLNRS